MSSITPGKLDGSWVATPAQAMWSSCINMAVLLSISVPVHKRPILVRRRIIGTPPARSAARSARRAHGILPASSPPPHLPSLESGAELARLVNRIARYVTARSTQREPTYHIGCVQVMHYSINMAVLTAELARLSGRHKPVKLVSQARRDPRGQRGA